MNIKNIISIFLKIILILIFANINFYNETIFIFISYVLLFNDKYLVLFLSSIIFITMDIKIFLKNIIFFIIFELFVVIFTNKKLNIKGKYRIFLLTFFVYLVLINIFEPIVYNYSRLLKSIYLYFLTFIFYKIHAITNK